MVVVRGGYHAAFLTLGAVAFVGLALFLLAMPETRDWENGPINSQKPA